MFSTAVGTEFSTCIGSTVGTDHQVLTAAVAVETVIVAAKEIYIVHEAITIFLGYWLFG